MCSTQSALDDLIARLAALPAPERSQVPGIKPARADIVLAGALVIQGVMRAGDFERLEVTGAGLREGIFFERQLVRRHVEPVLGLLGRPRCLSDLRRRYLRAAAEALVRRPVSANL